MAQPRGWGTQESGLLCLLSLGLAMLFSAPLDSWEGNSGLSDWAAGTMVSCSHHHSLPVANAWEPHAWPAGTQSEQLNPSTISLPDPYLLGFHSVAATEVSTYLPLLNEIQEGNSGLSDRAASPLIPTVCLSPLFHACLAYLGSTSLQGGLQLLCCPLGVPGRTLTPLGSCLDHGNWVLSLPVWRPCPAPPVLNRSVHVQLLLC